MVAVMLCAAGANAAIAGIIDRTGDYLALRDAAIKRLHDPFKNNYNDDAYEQLVLQDLARRIQNIVGPIDIPGFPDRGDSNLESLSPELGFGKLDGMTAQGAHGLTVFVTTLDLLQRWLTNPADGQAAKAASVLDIAAALRSEHLYGAGLNSDAAAVIYTARPVRPRPGLQDATAVLLLYTQDYPQDNLPDALKVAALRNGRLIVLTRKVSLQQNPICQAAWQQADRDAQALLAAYQGTHAADSALFARYEKQTDKASRDFVACYGAHVANGPDAASLAQDIAAMLDLLSPAQTK